MRNMGSEHTGLKVRLNQVHSALSYRCVYDNVWEEKMELMELQ